MFAALIGMMAAAVAAAGDAPPAAASPPPAGATTPAQPVDTDPMHKVECRRMEETGTRLGAKRVCMTREEWAAVARQARSMTEDVQTRGSSARTPGL